MPGPGVRAPARPDTIGSVVIAAHDEAAVIGRTLDRLFASCPPGVEVIVACNGCTDGTAGVVRRTGHPLTVVELAAASKARALRAAEAATTALPRVYLDADVAVSGRAVGAVLDHLSNGAARAARAPVAFDTSGCSAIVHRFYRARAALPAVGTALWGAGMYALSADGRRRFGDFPLVVADDLFVDRLFRRSEVEVVGTDPVVVAAPRTTGALVATLRRAHRGNRELARAESRGQAPTAGTVAALVRLARRGPGSFADAVTYAAVATAARALARVPAGPSLHWERDGTRR